MSNFKAVKLYVLILSVLIGSFIPLMGQGRLSNLEVADQTYFAALDSVLSGLPEAELTFSGLDNEQEAFLRSGWIQYWATKSSVEEGDSLVCTIDRMQLSFRYFDEAGHLFGLNDRLTREGILILRGWLSNRSDQKIIRAINISTSFRDYIESAELKQIERGPFSFLHGEFYTRSLWTRYLEPALVIVSVTAIVYLFFSVRT